MSSSTSTDNRAYDRSRSENYVARKEKARFSSRCGACWHPFGVCICARVVPLKFALPVQILVYQHHTDYLNAGDDAKLLLIAARESRYPAKLFVHGRQADEADLAAELSIDPVNTFLLFPSERAVSAEEFFEHRPIVVASPHSTISEPVLRVLVIDATWRHAKAMQRHLTRTPKLGGTSLPHVILSPKTLSVYARKQSQPDRICTVEAVALLLEEHIGEDPRVCETLISYVQMNNRALKRQETSAPSLWRGPGGHPAWYFGRRLW